MKARFETNLGMSSCECPRCKGFIVSDVFVTELVLLAGMRCVNCGWVRFDEERKEICKA